MCVIQSTENSTANSNTNSNNANTSSSNNNGNIIISSSNSNNGNNYVVLRWAEIPMNRDDSEIELNLFVGLESL